MSRGPARVLLVTHSLSGGGAERFVATLAGRLDRTRFAPAIAAATARATYRVPDDVPVIPLGYCGVASLPRTVLRLRRTIRAQAPGLVLSNVLSTNCLTGAALAGLDRVPPWIARVANSPAHGDPWLQRLWGRRVYPRAVLVVANSRGLAEAFVRYYPRAAGRTGSLPNPVDFERIDRLAGEAELADNGADQRAAGPIAARGAARGDGHRETVTVLWVGRLEPQKRPDLALAAVAELRRRAEAAGDPVPAVRLRLCGDGSLRRRLEERVAALGLGDAVELTGFLDNPFAAMAAADLFLSTSDFEGLPNALIEAQGLGLPAVATRCPFGPDEIIDDGETGLLVPVGDAAAMAEGLAALVADPARRRRLGEEAARRTRARFGIAAVVPRWEEALDAALAGHRPPDGGNV